jgi:hypothetical protein
MSRTLQTPTQNPAIRGQLDPNFKYVRVEMPNPRFEESNIDDFLDPNNDPQRPTLPIYEEVSRDRAITGNSRMALLRTPKEEFEKYQDELVEYSTRNLKRGLANDKTPESHIIGSFSEFDAGDGVIMKS